MNWLLYIGGWILGNHILLSEKEHSMPPNLYTFYKVLSWTMVWIWICWKASAF